MDSVFDFNEWIEENEPRALSEEESAALLKMNGFTANLKVLQSEFVEINEKYQAKRNEKSDYVNILCDDLAENRREIVSIFDDVRICMDDKELSLLCKLDEYKLKLNECAIEQIQIDSKLAATQTIIGRNLERIQEQEAFCEDVIDDGNAKHDGRIQNIIDEAEFAFEQSASAMDATKDAMNEQCVHNGAVCCIDLNESHLRIIKEHFESFIDVRSVADKDMNQECKIKHNMSPCLSRHNYISSA